MTERTQIIRGAARAVAGLVVVAAAAFGVLALDGAQLPAFERTPPSVQVDTTQDTTRTLVCAGSFAVLGADGERPDAAIPTGSPTLAVAGAPADTQRLERPEGGDGLPAVLSAPTGDPLAAAQLQSVSEESARGVAASSCNPPANEQWLLGGNTTKGVSTTLSLGNPGLVPATASVTVYNESGVVGDVQSTALRVPPGSEITVPINGYAPDLERLAVHVTSTGAAVTATLGVGHVIGLDPFAATTVTSQTEARTTLVVPGVSNVNPVDRGPNDSGDGDDFRVLVRVLAPGSDNGNARVFAVDAKGARTDLGAIAIASGAVAELQVPEWPKQANAVVIESDVPVIGGVLGSADNGKLHDYGWFAPAPEIEAGVPTAAAVVEGGKLVIENPGEGVATVELAGGKGKPRTVKIPAGAAVVASAPASDTTLLSDAPVHAGVRYLGSGAIDGYPVMPIDKRDGVLTVYTR